MRLKVLALLIISVAQYNGVYGKNVDCIDIYYESLLNTCIISQDTSIVKNYPYYYQFSDDLYWVQIRDKDRINELLDSLLSFQEKTKPIHDYRMLIKCYDKEKIYNIYIGGGYLIHNNYYKLPISFFDWLEKEFGIEEFITY